MIFFCMKKMALRSISYFNFVRKINLRVTYPKSELLIFLKYLSKIRTPFHRKICIREPSEPRLSRGRQKATLMTEKKSQTTRSGLNRRGLAARDETNMKFITSFIEVVIDVNDLNCCHRKALTFCIIFRCK